MGKNKQFHNLNVNQNYSENQGMQNTQQNQQGQQNQRPQQTNQPNNNQTQQKSSGKVSRKGILVGLGSVIAIAIAGTLLKSSSNNQSEKSPNGDKMYDVNKTCSAAESMYTTFCSTLKMISCFSNL